MAESVLPSQEVLRQLLDYNPETGALVWQPRQIDTFKAGNRQIAAWKMWNKRFAGKAACEPEHGNGYLRGSIFGKRFYAHRIIWKWVYGNDPVNIDHINGNRSDNRIFNLRSVSKSENAKNSAISKRNKSGHIGVCFNKQDKRWEAYLGDGKNRVRLGKFAEKSEAIAARALASLKFGYHTNHGRHHGNN